MKSVMYLIVVIVPPTIQTSGYDLLVLLVHIQYCSYSNTNVSVVALVMQVFHTVWDVNSLGSYREKLVARQQTSD